jgi:SAM-dependent methyltransferase
MPSSTCWGLAHEERRPGLATIRIDMRSVPALDASTIAALRSLSSRMSARGVGLYFDNMTDAQVDALLPATARLVSPMYWTPVRVARRAAQIFDDLEVVRVLDVGSGPGKFCVVAGARVPRISFVGIEQRPHLVAAARSLADAVGTTNVSFVHGDATSLPDTSFDGFYVFNSFAENGFSPHNQLDQTVELSPVRLIEDVMRVERWLATRPVGTVLMTYHGLGGPIPGSYECVHVEAAGTAWLRAWQKGRDSAVDHYWLEDDAEVTRATLEQVVRHLLPDPDDAP